MMTCRTFYDDLPLNSLVFVKETTWIFSVRVYGRPDILYIALAKLVKVFLKINNLVYSCLFAQQTFGTV